MARELLSWKRVGLICALFAAAAIAITAVGLAQQPPSPDQVRDADKAGISTVLNDVVLRLEERGRIWAGVTPCEKDCLIPDLASDLESAIDLCMKVDPKSILGDPAFDPRMHEPLATAFDRFCDLLNSTSRRAGPPNDNSAWRATVKEAQILLTSAVAATREPSPTPTQRASSATPVRSATGVPLR